MLSMDVESWDNGSGGQMDSQTAVTWCRQDREELSMNIN